MSNRYITMEIRTCEQCPDYSKNVFHSYYAKSSPYCTKLNEVTNGVIIDKCPLPNKDPRK